MHPQTTGSNHDALQTNLAKCARANLTMQLVTSSPAHSSAAMVVGRKHGEGFLTEISAHKEQQQLLGNEK